MKTLTFRKSIQLHVICQYMLILSPLKVVYRYSKFPEYAFTSISRFWVPKMAQNTKMQKLRFFPKIKMALKLEGEEILG